MSVVVRSAFLTIVWCVCWTASMQYCIADNCSLPFLEL